MRAACEGLPRLPGYAGPAAYGALPAYAAALHRRAGLDRPPYDPVRMAAAIGVSVRCVPTYEGNRGLLVPLWNRGYCIVVRASETPGARRFTVAHELMEVGLQIGCPALVERSYHDVGAGRAKERFCEVGAAEILMPLARVRAELQARGEGISSLLALSTLFGASLHATLRRIVEASSRPCAGLILHGDDLEAADDEPDLPPFWPSVHRAGHALVETPCLRVRAACGGGGLIAAVPRGAAVSSRSALIHCHREGTSLCAVEDLALGRLRGRFRIEAICPGRGALRHVYALLHPC